MKKENTRERVGEGLGGRQRVAGIRFKCFLEHDEGSAQVFLLQDVGDAHLILSGAGGGVETGGGSHHDGFSLIVKLVQTPGAEFLRIVNGQFCHGVECAHGNRGIDAGDAVQSVDETLASFDIFVIDLPSILFSFIERSLCHELSQEWGTEARLTEFHDRFANFRILGDERTDANAAFTVALGDRVNQDDVLVDAFKVAGGNIGGARVDELAIGVCKDSPWGCWGYR